MKKNIRLLIIIFLVIITLVGISYAWFNYYGEGKNSEFVAGNLYLRLDDGTKSISIPNALPESASHARNRDNNTLTFTIRGKNESQDDVIYSILLNNGNDIDGKNRFDASDIRFDLVEIDGNNRIMLLNAVSYTEFNQTPIWEEVVRKETDDVVTHTYELRMWIDENVNFGEGPGIKYTSDEYANLFASIKIAVDGHATNKNYQKLTFDGQGGEVERAYKYVVVGESYGELPTPTKEGYTFLGWNGKNKFPSDWRQCDWDGSNCNIRVSSDYKLFINANTNITISSSDDEPYVFVPLLLDTETLSRYSTFNFYSGMDNRHYNFTVDRDSYLMIVWAYDDTDRRGTFLSSDLTNVNLLVEYNNEKGEYEPYYVTSDVMVTEWNTDMVLKAVWKANTYDVVFNANGGTGTMNNQTIAYDEVANLSSNAFTREGYTFAGWSTSPNGSAITNLISGINLVSNMRLENNKYKLDYTDGLNDSYLKFDLSKNISIGNNYIFQIKIEGLTDDNYIRFNFPRQPSNVITIKNGINTIKFNDWKHDDGFMGSSTSIAFFDDIIRDETAIIYFSDWLLFEESENKMGRYANNQEVSNLAKSGTVNLYAVWTKNS